MEDLLAAYDLFPMSPFPCYQIAQVSEQLKEMASAVDWYRKVIQRAPRGSQIRTLARERIDALTSGVS